MIKNLIYLVAFFLFSFSGFSQEFGYGYGIKGGVNYAMGGQITGSDSSLNYWGGTVQGEGGIGYHGGAYLQVNFGRFFIRPEVVYNSLKQNFDIPLRESYTSFNVETITVPLLIGYKIFGPIEIYTGPVYSNVMNAKLEGLENAERTIIVQNTPINVQAGAKIELGRFGLDLRYEHTLSQKERQDLSFNNNYFGGENGGANKAWFDDARLNQIIVSVTFKIGGSGMGVRRRGSCF